MVHKKNNTAFWDERRGIIRSRKGGLVIGDGVYSHGYSLLDDLAGNASFFQVLTLNTTGRLPERRLADWLEALFICLSYPDARIWCNQIGSLGGTMLASPVAAISAGILASDSRLYGPGTLLAGTEFITKALQAKKQNVPVEEIIERHPKRDASSAPVIVGYARPIISGDERIDAMERISSALDFERGEHLDLAFEISNVLSEKYGETMNLVGYCTAFLCDQGFNAKEIYRLLSTWVLSGVHACYAEAADSPPESFLPLRCEDINYQGHPPRFVFEKDTKGLKE